MPFTLWNHSYMAATTFPANLLHAQVLSLHLVKLGHAIYHLLHGSDPHINLELVDIHHPIHLDVQVPSLPHLQLLDHLVALKSSSSQKNQHLIFQGIILNASSIDHEGLVP